MIPSEVAQCFLRAMSKEKQNKFLSAWHKFSRLCHANNDLELEDFKNNIDSEIGEFLFLAIHGKSLID